MASTGIIVEGCQDRVAIISGKVLFEFLPGRGVYNITLGDGAHLLSHARLAFRSGRQVIDSTSYREVRWRVVNLGDNLGEGKAFVVHFGGNAELPGLTADFSFYEGKEIVAVGMQVDNTTGHPMLLDELLPILCKEKGGGLSFGEVAGCRVLRGNWANLDGQPHLYSAAPGVSVDAPNSLLLCDSRGGAAVVWGIFEPARCLTSFHLSFLEKDHPTLEFFARQRPVAGAGGEEDARGITLRENKSFSTGRIAIVFDEGPHAALEKYAESVGMVNTVPGLERIPCGWSNGSQHAGMVAEEQVLSHARFIAKELKRYGLRDVLIDAGWQVSGDFCGGPWNPGESFPRGMRSVVDKVHAKGLRIGLWFRPLDLEKMRLDPSSEFTKNFLRKEAAKITQEWGFDFIKVDMVDWDAFGRKDRYFPEDDSASTNEAVRASLEVMSSGLGEGAFLIGQEAAFPATLGVVHAAGIVRGVEARCWRTLRKSALKAAALRYHLHNTFWVNDPGYVKTSKPATLSQARAWASLIALSGGCVLVGDSLLSMGEKRISIIKKIIPPFGKAARPMDLLENSSPKIWVLEVVKPFGKWHIVGLFNWDCTPGEIEESYRESVQSNIAILKQNDQNEGIERSIKVHRKIAADNRLIRKENERIASVLKSPGIAGFRLKFPQPVRRIRKSPRFRNFKVSFRKLGLDGSVSYLVYDFWADAFLGEHRGRLQTLVKLAKCRILAIRPRLGRPQLLSTNRHVTQGGIELKDLRWDDGRCELKGHSEVVGGDDYSVTLHVPRDYKFLEMKADCDEFKAESRTLHLTRLWFKNKRSKTIAWRARFEKVV